MQDSRVEFVRCELRGTQGGWGGGPCDDGEDGGTAIVVQRSFVHFALTDVVGGNGGTGAGTGCFTTCNGYGGLGGNGLTAYDSDIVMAGDGTQVIQAGDGGWSSCFTFSGFPGYGAFVAQCSLRFSGVTFVSYFGRELFTPNTVITTPSLDPTVEVLGTQTPGAQVSVVVRGNPGDYVRFELGRAPTLVDIHGSAIGRLVTPGRAISLGPLPASGQVSIPLTIPVDYPIGTALWLQASAVDGMTGQGQSANSAPLLIR